MREPTPAPDPTELDPNFVPVVEAFADAEPVTYGKTFASPGLKVNGKIFALLVRGDLVVKLPRARVIELIAAGAGKPWDRGKGTPLKEWVAVPPGHGDWVALAREAYQFVAAG